MDKYCLVCITIVIVASAVVRFVYGLLRGQPKEEEKE